MSIVDIIFPWAALRQARADNLFLRECAERSDEQRRYWMNEYAVARNGERAAEAVLRGAFVRDPKTGRMRKYEAAK